MAWNRVKRAYKCQDGTTAILTAILLTVLLWCGAFAVDIASLYLDRRTAQGVVDLAAIAAAKDIENAERMALVTLKDNGIRDIEKLSVRLGKYTPEPSIEPSERFVEGAEPYNAVQVNLQHRSPLYFAGALLGVETFAVSTRAVAATTAQGAFSIGSRLARLEGGIANAALGGLLDGKVALTAMDYEALADANIKLLDFMDALATELDIEAGSFNDVLNADATAGHIIDAMADVTAQSGDASAASTLRILSAQSNAWSKSVSLNGLIDAGPYGNMNVNSPSPGFNPNLNVMQMLSATAAIANGDNQVTLNLGAKLPGLADILVDLAIGEPPQHASWFTVGETGSIVRTAQTRLRIEITAAPGKLLPGVSVRVPLYLEVAYAEARLDSLKCGANPAEDARAEIAARPGIAELWLGDISSHALRNFSRRPRVGEARMVDLPLMRVTGKAHASVTNMHETTLAFDWADAEDATVKRTHTRDYFASLFVSLLDDLNLKVKTRRLGLSLPGPAARNVKSLLAALSSPLDTLVSGLLEAVGVTLGEADIRMHGFRCDGSVLAG